MITESKTNATRCCFLLIGTCSKPKWVVNSFCTVSVVEINSSINNTLTIAEVVYVVSNGIDFPVIKFRSVNFISKDSWFIFFT